MPLDMEAGLGPDDIVLDADPAPPGKGHSSSPTFQPMSVVAKRSTISATAELLSYLLQYEHVYSPSRQKYTKNKR